MLNWNIKYFILIQECYQPLSCRGLCTLYPDCIRTRRIDYSKGRKLCITCNRIIVSGLTDLLRCPCCNMLFRIDHAFLIEKCRVKNKIVSQQNDTSYWPSWILICPICNNSDKTVIADPECGEIICSNCGMVISDKIREGTISEWCAFNTIELNDRSRIGTPTTLARHDMGLATVIGRSSRDASGQKIDPVTHSTLNRLRIINHRTQRYTSIDINRKRL